MTTSAVTTDPSREIVAKAGKSYRWRRWVMALLLIGGGAWFLHDGYKGWPEHNHKLDQMEAARNKAEAARDQVAYDEMSHQISREHARYSDASLFLQKLLGFSLPPIGIIFLIRMLYASRGEVRLKDEVIMAPGHPPIPFSAIRELDKRQWDRKGIAIVRYEVDGRPRILTLDDFVYEQDPIDAIYDRVLKYVAPPSAMATTETVASGNEETQP
jgi:hypothetical protein